MVPNLSLKVQRLTLLASRCSPPVFHVVTPYFGLAACRRFPVNLAFALFAVRAPTGPMVSIPVWFRSQYIV